MKKKSSKPILLLAVGSFATIFMVSAADVYRGNSSWENKSPYFPIVEENFRDWNYTDAEGFGLKKPEVNTCATNARSDYENYSTFEVKRAVDSRQNKPNGKVTFFLDFCQIQPDCDTQSGTNYTLDSTVVNNDSKGPSWNNVSKGCISIYDNYSTVRPITEGFSGDGAGSFTTSLIPLLERVQYTTSSYGNKRGFNLEIGYLLEDQTVYWDTLRYFTGNLTTIRPDAFLTELSSYTLDNTSFIESNRGLVFEELFGSGVENVYLRFRPTDPKHNRQIVRIHDLRLYGNAPDTDAATNPNPVTGFSNVTMDTNLQIFGYDGHYKLNKEANVIIYNFSGKVVKKINNVRDIELSDLSKGVYFVKANSKDGVTTRKIVR